MVGFGDIPAIYPLCSIGRQFSTAVLSFTSPASPSSPPSPTGSRSFEGATDDSRSFQIPSDVNGEKLVSSAADGSAETVVGRMEVLRLSEDQGTGNIPVRGGPSDCYWGELTDLGRQSTLTLGARLRALYVDQLGFLPSSLPDLPPASSPVAFRSTGMPRTIESLHQIVQGLFPERDGPVQYVVRNAMDESLYPNSMCARMRRLDEESAKRAALTWNPSLAPLDSLIGKYINGPVRIDGHPRANGILDTVMVCLAHKIRVPKEFDDEKLLETLENAVVHEWFDGYQSPEFAKLAMGRLLGDLKAALERKVADPFEVKDKLRLAVNSCHDTSLGGILNALNVFDSRWPPFTSHISFELFRPTSSKPSYLSSFLPTFLQASSTPHYIRMRYNGKTLTIPSCKPPGKHLPGSDGKVCTLEAFKEAVEQVAVTAEEWECGCAAR